MSINTDYKTAVELTGAAQAAAEAFESSMPLTQWLPPKQNPTLMYEFDASDTTSVDVAQYRAFDTPAPYGLLGPKITKEGKLPPISRKLPVSEYTQLQWADKLDQLGTLLEEYAAKLGVGIAARLEIARVEAVTTGRVTLDENGIRATIDYGRDPALTLPLPAKTKRWNTAGALPVDDLIRWRDQVKKTSHGSLPTTIMLSNAVMNTLAQNAQIIAYALGRTDNLPGRVSAQHVRDVLAGYAGIGNVIIADDAYSGFNFGRSVWPDGTVVLLPPTGVINIDGQGLGSTSYGVTAEAIQPDYGIAANEQAGIFAAAFGHPDPEGLDVLASAVALPLLQRANTTLGAQVITTEEDND
ncbi:MAG: major capsid protein [Propionibacteriaceae bacterium]|jgi:hypothetical protein|nr:major capsid protein [Propionibacteriaceae bacterium]